MPRVLQILAGREGHTLPFCFSGFEEITVFLLCPINVTTTRQLQNSACLLWGRARYSTPVTSTPADILATPRGPLAAFVVTALPYTSTAAGSKQRRVCAPAVSACAGFFGFQQWVSQLSLHPAHSPPKALSRTVRPCHSSPSHHAHCCYCIGCSGKPLRDARWAVDLAVDCKHR